MAEHIHTILVIKAVLYSDGVLVISEQFFCPVAYNNESEYLVVRKDSSHTRLEVEFIVDISWSLLYSFWHKVLFELLVKYSFEEGVNAYP